MLTQEHINIIKSTIPLLESAGPALTQHFYQRMFSHNPELKHIFNMTHQKTGRQSVALFEAIAAYAKHIDNLAALTSAVERIAHKHTSFNIQPEHYQIVGHHLLETLRELAPDAFTQLVEEAWTAAYFFLAQVFIDREGALYLERKQALGGWRDGRTFVVREKQVESAYVTSFVLVPADGGAVLDYQPGQYIGIEVTPEGSDYREIRQYSLSHASNGREYRISVKREGVGSDHPGLVSHYLHNNVKVGDSVKLYAPAGDFFYVERERPVVLISAGVGATPMQAILHTLAKQNKSGVTYLYACNSAKEHTFAQETAQLIAQQGWMQQVWYRDESADDVLQGEMQLAELTLPIEDGDFYLCGPIGFMQYVVKQLLALGVDKTRIHYEVFGPHAQLAA
ncbi:NO-inducible flavohemoprotein [Vibrio cholerae]|uniref:NO-inducible flavohemoprotein n=1 Tax=Vibrio cholerae TaxID=666 RepID=UPI0011D65D4D|nr:NO-inducible flavohemoprotein [Vibrio cholerae]EKG0017076.1 NO-inducible flavohemoprotein [Vibrio cholerae]ELA3030266.1 NO-inducible flavohemoprotein [Vibrio cholerae]ELN7715464.1 NO-inducible flavohemoprotein [Vibrio cholerae]KAA1197633.1 NO-inducible flavohemoprotein [Vibrio cholerae]TXY24789.1 NO-inducible flavohemoprotein [Vibrio cholerae]